MSAKVMEYVKRLIPLREYCRQHEWPRLPQWHHWIYSKHAVALKCIKRIGGRYMVDMGAFEEYVKKATLMEFDEQ